jgi:subtilisin family serine protease
MALRSLLVLAIATSCVALSTPALGQLELGAALRDLSRGGTRRLPRAVLQPASGRVALLADHGPTSDLAELLIGGRYRPLWLAPEEVEPFIRDNPQLTLHWSPPRRPLLDRADGWVRAGAFRNDTGLTGKGVVIGIIDTGLDVSHRDLRDTAGGSRLRFLLDLSRAPAERQAELEDEYGCHDQTTCAIYSAADLDELLANGVRGDEPSDTLGHGTHVASLAAGNGLAGGSSRYVGVAPEATLIGARVSRAGSGTIFDADIVLATRFVFEQAERLGLPAVVNLSLGSDFGAHDGSSPLELSLASFVGPRFPGRALVVAAGNSGTLYQDTGSGEPEPLGIHTEVHVPRESRAEVPLITPRTAAPGGGTFYVWLGFRPGDEVALGLGVDGAGWIPDVAPGQATTYRRGELEGTIFNGPSKQEGGIEVPAASAVVIVDGDFEPGTVFTLRLSGHGTANVWVQSQGGLSPDVSEGVLVPRGEKQGTINVPASHPDLIAVGATVNRNRWRDWQKGVFFVGAEDGSEQLAELDGTALFSAAGPNALGVMKPDLVAPGMFVAGAMSSRADPRLNGGSGLFASQGRCGEPDYECFVVDDGEHAVTSGTSMAAPLVAGAIALLLEARPELTQAELRALLQAGARRPTGPVLSEQQVGPGVLDLEGTLAALRAEDSPITRLPAAASRITLARSFIHPDPSQRLTGLLELRDADGQIADGFDERRLELSVAGGALTQLPLRLGPGLYRFELSAPEGTSGRELEISLAFDGVLLTTRRVPIGVDRWSAEGDPSPRGGCSTSRPAPTSAASLAGASLLALALLRLRRRGR